jgi:membrane-associated protein
VAAIVGDTVGYWIGAKSGPKIFSREQSLLFSRKHLLRTKEFYERHGGKTIIMARFMPFLRTFAPVVAGVGQMSYRRFLSFNIIGGIAWVVSMTMLGFSLGSVYPGITKQIDKVVIVIIAVSLIPGAISYLMNRKKTPPKASLAA